MIDVNAYLGHFAFRRLRHNTALELLKLMDSKGIRQAVVASAAAIAYRNPQPGNDDLAAETGPHRARLIPFATINPVYAGWRDDLKACHETHGMKGLRLHPHWHRYKLSDPACIELVEAAAGRGMIVSIPVRVEDPRQRSWLADIQDVPLSEIEGLVRAVPKARFLILSGGGFARTALGRRDSGLPSNYWIEICRVSSVMGNEMGQLVTNLGADRLVFGTGIPFHYADPAMLNVEVLDAPEDVKARIRRGNAAALLGL